MSNKSYIFEKVMVRGPQKQYSRVSDVQIHKYTNTALVKVEDIFCSTDFATNFSTNFPINFPTDFSIYFLTNFSIDFPTVKEILVLKNPVKAEFAQFTVV